MIRVLHTGDLHLDSTFRGLTPKKARQRREEQRELLTRLKDLAVERAVDVVLIAGDLFDGDGVYYETTQMLAETFARIPARIFIAPGNHDPYSDRSPYAAVRWPENVHLFRSEGMERVELPERNAVVYGTAFTSKYRDTSPLANFKPDYDEGLTRLMVLHGDLSSGKSRYGALTAAQIAGTKMDYVALGHIHRFIDLWREGGTAFAYCGCPEGRGFDETGEKGVLLGTVSPGEAQMEFLPLARRRYQEIAVDVTGKEAERALLEAVPADCEADIYRFRLIGERQEERLDLGRLASLLRGRFFEVQLLDETVPAVDVWARVEEDTLTGLFLRNMRARLERADAGEKSRLERALRFGLAALEGREEPK